MSIIDIQGELLASLESALDVTKIFSVFSRLMSVIKDQQSKINEFETKLKNLAAAQDAAKNAKAGPAFDFALESRLMKIEERVQELQQAVEGVGEAPLIASPEHNPYRTFENSAMAVLGHENSADFDEFVPDQPSIREIDEPEFGGMHYQPQGIDDQVMKSAVVSERASPIVDLPVVEDTVEQQIEPAAEIPVEVVEEQPSEPEPVVADPVPAPEVAEEAPVVNEEVPPEPEPEPIQETIVAVEEIPEASPQYISEQSFQPTAAAEEEQQPQPQQMEYQMEVIDQIQQMAPFTSSPVMMQQLTPPMSPPGPKLASKHVTPRPDSRDAMRFSPVPMVTESPRPAAASETTEKKEIFSVPGIAAMKPGHSGDVSRPTTASAGRIAVSRPITPSESNIPQGSENSSLYQINKMSDLAQIKRMTISRRPHGMPHSNNGSQTAIAEEPLGTPQQPYVMMPRMTFLKKVERRRMNAANLTLLTAARRAKICRELRRRGQFMLVSSNMFEETRLRQANQTLKSKVDFLDSEIKRMKSTMDKLKSTTKKTFHSLRNMLPPDFNNVFDQLLLMLQLIHEGGGLDIMMNNLNTLMYMPSPNSIMCYDLKGDVPLKLIDAIISRMKSTFLHEYEMNTANELNKLKSRMVELGSNVALRSDIHNMLSQPTNNLNSMADLFGEAVSTDPNHTKLVNLINKCIDRFMLKQEMGNSQKGYARLELKGGISQNEMEALLESGQKYTDEKIAALAHELEHVQYSSDSRAHKFEMDLSLAQERLGQIINYQHMTNATQQEAMENLKKESESLRVLQRKVANMAVDKLIDEIKKLQRDLEERPSTTQVGTMIDLIEATMKAELGENFHDMKGLVDQVYQRIQHKVDREDIKKLITAKLAQMEADLLRREEEVYSLSSTTRCLSCGQRRVDPLERMIQTNHGVPHSAADALHRKLASPEHMIVNKPSTIQQHAQQQQQRPATTMLMSMTHPASAASTIQVDNDDITVSSLGSLQQPNEFANNSAFITGSAVSGDQISRLVTGGGGLKPLLQQYPPMQPVKDPYAVNKKKTEKIPEPLYRKAKMAAQIKEMVKVNPSSVNFYGFGPANPMFVLDGSDNANSGGEDFSQHSVHTAQSFQAETQAAPISRNTAGGVRGKTSGSSRTRGSAGNSTAGSDDVSVTSQQGAGGARLHVSNLSNTAAGQYFSSNNSVGGSSVASSKRGAPVADYVTLPAISSKQAVENLHRTGSGSSIHSSTSLEGMKLTAESVAEENLLRARKQMDIDQELSINANAVKMNTFY